MTRFQTMASIIKCRFPAVSTTWGQTRGHIPPCSASA
jgi:hypothetical protein